MLLLTLVVCRMTVTGTGDGIKVLPDGRRFTGMHWHCPHLYSVANSFRFLLNVAFSGALLDGRPHGQGMVDKDESQVPCTFDEGVFMCYNPKD